MFFPRKYEYILLDIDGVLNTKEDWKYPYSLNPNCVRQFGLTFQKTEAKIILISSWRKGFISKGNPNNSPQVQKLEKALNVYNLGIHGILNYDGSRGKAVAEFQKSHRNTICIDDDIEEYEGYEEKIENLVIVDNRTGFQKGYMKKSIY